MHDEADQAMLRQDSLTLLSPELERIAVEYVKQGA